MKGLTEKERQNEFNRMYHFVEQSIGSYGIKKASIDCNNYAHSITNTINTLDYDQNSLWIDTLSCRLFYLKQAMSDNGIEINA